jgi:hypothetical protein
VRKLPHHRSRAGRRHRQWPAELSGNCRQGRDNETVLDQFLSSEHAYHGMRQRQHNTDVKIRT